MTRELIIEGQHIDLAPDTDITLEYASNLLDEPGKLNLTHSYTIKIPRTLRNARILQVPERPANEQGLVRRYLSARYYRNGIDLLGPARAYVIRSTEAQYNIAIVSESLANLQELIESKGSLNDLPGLPMLQWIGTSGKGPDFYSADFGFAKYQSGLPADPYPTYYTASHPYARVVPLLRMILQNAGVPFSFDETETVDTDMYDTVILAAPSHKPNKGMETESGIIASNVVVLEEPTAWPVFSNYAFGWDSPKPLYWTETTLRGFFPGGRKFRLTLNFAAPIGQNWSNTYLELTGALQGTLSGTFSIKRWPFVKDDTGVYRVFIEEEMTPESSWTGLWITYQTLENGEYVPFATTEAPVPYDLQQPMMTVNFIHDHIDIAYDNRFPLQGNLPDISQWDLIRSVCAIFGLRLTVKGGVLHFSDVQTWYDRSKATDWSGRLADGTGETSDITYSINSWARKNNIVYKEDDKEQVALPFNPDATLKVDDQTLKDSRDYYKLPFAASTRDVAEHYEIKNGETENIDIAPRIFRLDYVNDVLTLTSPEEMYGQALIERYYPDIQKAVERPVIVSTEVRLSEIDLKTLDLSRAVYLSQYGRYYAILKVQTSKTDICKVELLQLP